MMKRLLLAGATFSVLAGTAVAVAPALAQSPPMVANWAGCYLGPTFGGDWGDSAVKGTPNGAFPLLEPTVIPNLSAITTGHLHPAGAIGGGEIGCNFQSGSFVFGLEGDMSGWGFSQGVAGRLGPGDPLAPGTTLTSNTSIHSSWLATVRPRIGYAVNNWLLYATGGVSLSEMTAKQSVFFSATGSTQAGKATSSDMASWVAGGGLEYSISPAWSVKGEYLYVDLPSVTVHQFNPAFPTFTQTTKFSNNANVIRVGLNYHFGAPAPMPPAPMAAPAPPPAAPVVFIVFFDWDKDTITREGMGIVQQAADAYKSGAPVQIQVTGYTDRSGSPGYNQRLSERRANRVAKALAALGVPPASMVVTGRGENDNRVPTADGVREPQNRRVEIVKP